MTHSLVKFLFAILLASALSVGCSKKEDPVAEATEAVEQAVQYTAEEAEEAKEEAIDAIAAAKKPRQKQRNNVIPLRKKRTTIV